MLLFKARALPSAGRTRTGANGQEENIQTTGTNQGPRSPGALVAAAGLDQTVPFGAPLQLQGVVLFSNAPPTILAIAAILGWKVHREGHLELWGGRRDLNPRQPDPQSGALTRLSYGHQPADILSFGAPPVKLAPRFPVSCRKGLYLSVFFPKVRAWSRSKPTNSFVNSALRS